MHGDHVIVFAQRTAANTAQFLHVTTYTEKETEMHAKRTDICAGLTRHPEDGQVALLIKLKEVRFVDGTNTELTLDGRDERGTLEEGTRQGLNRARKGSRFGKSRVETKNSNVFLSCI